MNKLGECSVGCRWIQEDILGRCNARNGGGIDVQCCYADAEIHRLPGQRQIERRPPGTTHLPVNHSL